MTIHCATCGCADVRLIDDNGATYPETRVELYECADCGHQQRKVLSA
jgi:Zn ribbon nucleic-acid-binding protein